MFCISSRSYISHYFFGILEGVDDSRTLTYTDLDEREALHCIRFDPADLHADYDPSTRVHPLSLEHTVIQSLALDAVERENFTMELRRAKKDLEVFDMADLRKPETVSGDAEESTGAAGWSVGTGEEE